MTNAGAPYTCPITRPWQKSLRPPIVYRSPSPPRGDGRKPCTRPLLPNTCPRHRAVKETLRFVSIPATPATRCYEALHPSTPSEYPPRHAVMAESLRPSAAFQISIPRHAAAKENSMPVHNIPNTCPSARYWRKNPRFRHHFIMLFPLRGGRRRQRFPLAFPTWFAYNRSKHIYVEEFQNGIQDH